MSLGRVSEKKIAKQLVEWEENLPPKNGFLHVETEFHNYLKDYVYFLQKHNFEIISVMPINNLDYLVTFR